MEVRKQFSAVTCPPPPQKIVMDCKQKRALSVPPSPWKETYVDWLMYMYISWFKERKHMCCIPSLLNGSNQSVTLIIIIIKICSAHISTLLGAQGAETEKTWIQTIYNDSKTTLCAEIHVQCDYKYTSSLKNCDIRWVLSSDLNLVLLWQDLSLVGRWFQSLGAATEKDLSPQVHFEVGSFRSDMLLERKLRDGV